MREDGCVMLRHPTHDVGASSSRAALAAPDGATARPEQELWQEFHDLGTLLNNALIEALRIHTGPAWRAFQVRNFCWVSEFFPSPLSFITFALALPQTQLPLCLVRW
jgi:hypothetical protein